MHDGVEFLRALLSPYLSVNEARLQATAPFLKPVRYAPGELLFDQGAVCREVVLIPRGLARAYYIHEGREVNLRLICGPGVATAMSSLITGAPSEEWVEAISPLNGYLASFEDLEARFPGGVSEKIRRVLAEQHYLAVERRLRMLQWKSVAERYAAFCELMEPDVVQQTPGYHIASYLGVAPETLSRIRRKRSTN